MKPGLKGKGFKRLLLSFKYAFEGIIYTVKNEQNFIIHLLAVLTVTTLGYIYKISNTEWLIIVIMIALVLGSEFINTSIEATIDSIGKVNPLAKVAKDTAAAAVLIFALSSIIVALIIFIPKIGGSL